MVDRVTPETDPRLYKSLEAVKVSDDSGGRWSRAYPAVANGNGSWNRPIEGQTAFNIDYTTTRPHRWSNMALRLRGTFVSKRSLSTNDPAQVPLTGAPGPMVATTANNNVMGSEATFAGNRLPHDSVLFDGISRLFSQVTLNINTTPVVSLGLGNTFPQIFLSNLLLNHSYEELESHPALFQPCFDSKYCAASKRYDRTANGAVAGAVIPFGGQVIPGFPPLQQTPPAAHVPGAVADAFGECPYRPNYREGVDHAMLYRDLNPNTPTTSATIGAASNETENKAAISGAVNIAIGNVNALMNSLRFVEHSNLMCSPEATERARRWIGESSHTRTITRYIPLSDMFGIYTDNVLCNARSLGITINWAQATTRDMMIHLDQDEEVWGSFSLTNVDLVSDGWVASAGAVEKSVAEKLVGNTTVLHFQEPHAMNVQYNPGMAITVPGIHAAAKVVMMSDNRPQSWASGAVTNGLNNVITSDGAVAGAANVLGNVSMVYQNGLSFLGALSATSAAPTTPSRYLYPWSIQRYDAHRTQDDYEPCQMVFTTIGGQQYPLDGIRCSEAVIGSRQSFDPMNLFYEYRKAMRAGKNPGCPMKYFGATMPFLCLDLSQSDSGLPTISNEGTNVIISPQGGTTCNVTCIVYKNRIIEINPQGDIQTIL